MSSSFVLCCDIFLQMLQDGYNGNILPRLCNVVLQDGWGKGKELNTTNSIWYAISLEAVWKPWEGSAITQTEPVFHEQVMTKSNISLLALKSDIRTV